MRRNDLSMTFFDKNDLTQQPALAYAVAMNNPTPEQIEYAAAEANLTMTAVLERAGVGRESFYRAKRGAGNMTLRTALKLRRAIDELRA